MKLYYIVLKAVVDEVYIIQGRLYMIIYSSAEQYYCLYNISNNINK